MKKLVGIIIILVVLIMIFLGLWAIKLNTPIEQPDSYINGNTETPWWENSNGEAPTPDEDWILDHEIPENYIPVLGREELYMVIDENGNIIKYRQRTKQEDGSWLWEDIDPNIPQNYEPVAGLENVYKVVDPDGSVHYYLYTRNSDDTYFFIEVDEYGDPLIDNTPNGDEIPANFIRIEGTNIYAVYNEYGVLIGYKERIENPDGSYTWVDVDAPATSSGIINGQGGIPNSSSNSNSSSNITIVDNSNKVQKGYTEQHSYTDTKHENGWVIVYETIVTKTYDEKGNLTSTKSEGPTEVNRIPETEWNFDMLKTK